MDTHHEFTLPPGHIAARGHVHRVGRMRLATVLDERAAALDPRGRTEPRYQAIVALARVVTKLGELEGDRVTPEMIESLSPADLAVLSDLYRRLNEIQPS